MNKSSRKILGWTLLVYIGGFLIGCMLGELIKMTFLESRQALYFKAYNQGYLDASKHASEISR